MEAEVSRRQVRGSDQRRRRRFSLTGWFVAIATGCTMEQGDARRITAAAAEEEALVVAPIGVER